MSNINAKLKKSDGTTVFIYHSGNFNPADYLPLTGGTISDVLTINNKLVVSKNTQLFGAMNSIGTATFTGKSIFNGDVDTTGNVKLATANVTGVFTVDGKSTFKDDTTFKKGITIEGITKFGNGLEVDSGISRFKGNTFISTLESQTAKSPTILLGLGTYNTGIDSNSSGVLSYVKNGVVKYGLDNVWHSGNFTPNDKFNVAGGTISGSVVVTGSFHSNGDITAFSDERLKTEITELGREEFDKIINTGCFDYIRANKPEYGVIAQRIEKDFPRIVTEGSPDRRTGIRYKRVKYLQFIPLLINGIKILYKDIVEIKAELKNITAELKKINEKINK